MSFDSPRELEEILQLVAQKKEQPTPLTEAEKRALFLDKLRKSTTYLEQGYGKQ